METLSALLAFLCGNPQVTGGFPSQKASNAGFGVFSEVNLNKRLHKQSNTGDLRRHDRHCDVTLMEKSDGGLYRYIHVEAKWKKIYRVYQLTSPAQNAGKFADDKFQGDCVNGNWLICWVFFFHLSL